MTGQDALELVATELDRARSRFGDFNSAHEGYAVLLEEMDELWSEIKDDRRDPIERAVAMRAEACQLAAMATRLMVDCT